MTRDLPQGWLLNEEADRLAEAARGRVVLELGAWKGRSTVLLTSVAEYVVSVDRHTGIPVIPDSGDSLQAYLSSVRELPNLAIVVASFADFVPLLRGGFGLVYIDGDHDADSVERDARLAVALEPELMAFHDYGEPGVIAGIERVLGAGRPDRLSGSLAVFEMALHKGGQQSD